MHNVGFLCQEKLEEGDSGLSLGHFVERVEDGLLEGFETLGVLLLAFCELVGDLGGDVDPNIGLLTRNTLGVEVGGGGAEGCGELVDEESGDLGELGSVLLSALCKEIHCCLFNNCDN